jgi:hypothetical protein
VVGGEGGGRKELVVEPAAHEFRARPGDENFHPLAKEHHHNCYPKAYEDISLIHGGSEDDEGQGKGSPNVAIAHIGGDKEKKLQGAGKGNSAYALESSFIPG